MLFGCGFAASCSSRTSWFKIPIYSSLNISSFVIILFSDMIIDVHTHLSTREQWGPVFCQASDSANAQLRVDLNVTPERHAAALQGVERAIVFGINSIAFGLNTPNDAIADYVACHPDKFIGFMSVDPHQESALEEIDRSAKELGLRGIKMSPVYQNYHPHDERAQRVHRRAEELGLPILTHAAFHSIAGTNMDWANPILYDEVARDFPKLKIILAHIGLPWFDNAMVVVRKHPNVYADVSPAFHRHWLYRALLAFQEFDVMGKLLFASDFPFSTPEKVCQVLRAINDPLEGTKLPRIEEEAIEALIHRDAYSLLGFD